MSASEQLISFDDSPDASPTEPKANIGEFDPFKTNKQSDLLLEIDSEIQNGADTRLEYEGDQNSDSLLFEYTVETSSDINSTAQYNEESHEDENYAALTNEQVGNIDAVTSTNGNTETHENEDDSDVNDDSNIGYNHTGDVDNNLIYNGENVHEDYAGGKDLSSGIEASEVEKVEDIVENTDQDSANVGYPDEASTEIRSFSGIEASEVEKVEEIVEITDQYGANVGDPYETSTEIRSFSGIEALEVEKVEEFVENTDQDSANIGDPNEVSTEIKSYSISSESDTDNAAVDGLTNDLQPDSANLIPDFDDSPVNIQPEVVTICTVPEVELRESKEDDMEETVEVKAPVPSQRQSVGKSRDVRMVSEDDMTKSPSSSDGEEEEVIQDGEVVYRSSDEEHKSEYMNEAPKFRDNFITGEEPGVLSNRIVAFEDYEHTQKSSKEHITSPGKLKSPFIDGSVQEKDQEITARDKIKFAEMSNVRSRFEVGGSDYQKKGPHTITPPRDARTEFVSNEDARRDPNIVRADDDAFDDESLPKVGSSLQTVQKLNEVSKQDRDYRPKKSVKDEIEGVGRVEYENEPDTFVQWENKTEGGIYENTPEYKGDVVREQDSKIGEELPEVGYTRNVLQHFKAIQSNDEQYKPKSVRRELTPPLSGQVEYASEPQKGIQLYEGKPEAGIFESQPQIRDDVVHADEGEEIVVPEKGYTKNVAKMFKQLSESHENGWQMKGQKEFTPPREESRSPASGVIENYPDVTDSVRETDQTDDAVPTQGSARNMVARFQQMQQETEHPRNEERGNRYQNHIGSGDAGIYENQPDVNEFVVHADDSTADQLPEQGAARNLVAQFRQMEQSNASLKKSSKSPRSPLSIYKEFTPPRDEAKITKSPNQPGGGIQPNEMPEQYQSTPDLGGVFENKPDYREDVSREADTDWTEGMPVAESTKSLVERFKDIQKTAELKSKTPKAIPRKDSTTYKNPPSSNQIDTSGRSAATSNSKETSVRFRAVQSEKCSACHKTVYVTERFEFNKCVYHKTCFKCSHCRRPLTPATYAVNEHKMYCMTHYKQMFKTKGNYDEGFGRSEYKKRWQSEPNLSSSNEDDFTSNYRR